MGFITMKKPPFGREYVLELFHKHLKQIQDYPLDLQLFLCVPSQCDHIQPVTFDTQGNLKIQKKATELACDHVTGELRLRQVFTRKSLAMRGSGWIVLL